MQGSESRSEKGADSPQALVLSSTPTVGLPSPERSIRSENLDNIAAAFGWLPNDLPNPPGASQHRPIRGEMENPAREQ